MAVVLGYGGWRVLGDRTEVWVLAAFCKSTIAKLLARFHDPEAGAVSLDGVDLRDLADAELRRAVVLVTQENHLFSGSVAENIRFGRPTADDVAVENAARAIGAHDFIAALPDGYATEPPAAGTRPCTASGATR